MAHRPRIRRALQGASGPVTVTGPAALKPLLAEALRVPEEADPRELTHGFHSYPARFHPLLPRRLLAGVKPSSVVLDPFVGSGTTLVEAMCAGAHAFGVDINPLAVELSRLKATPMSDTQLGELSVHAAAIREASLDRVKRRARTQSSGEEYDDPRHYAPHVFRELVGLRELIGAEHDPLLRKTLLLVLSSIIIKLSRQPSDTAYGSVERAIGKGHPSRLFQRKTDELVARLRDFSRAVPAGTPRPDVRIGDARALRHISPATVDLIITSPPYVGTYDYAEHHARRFGWIGLSEKSLQNEIGARRQSKNPAEALAQWQIDTDDFVKEFRRVLKPGGRAFVATGDSALGRQAIPGDRAIRHGAEVAGLTVLAHAVQERRNYHRPTGSQTRREHLLLLTKP